MKLVHNTFGNIQHNSIIKMMERVKMVTISKHQVLKDFSWKDIQDQPGHNGVMNNLFQNISQLHILLLTDIEQLVSKQFWIFPSMLILILLQMIKFNWLLIPIICSLICLNQILKEMWLLKLTDIWIVDNG